MANTNMNNPTVFMFSEDLERIKQVVDGHKAVETSGDLFGLWTEHNEPVVHLVTEQAGREDAIKDTRKQLCQKFQLPRIGKWQYQGGPKQIQRSKMEAVLRDDKPLWKNDNQYALFIAVNHDETELALSPYIVSKTSISRKGKAEFLEGENAFRKVNEIREIIGDSSVQTGGANESEGADAEMKPVPQGERDIAKKMTTYADPLQTRAKQSEIDFVFGAEKVSIPRPRPIFDSYQSNDLRVYMFKEDQEMMTKLVLRYPNVETGGDLFGLWTSEGDAVLHIVLGPGKDCKRTDVSFNQDVPYLQRNGELLTEKYMLGHIGEWHSHHQLHLFKPSHGDSSTVIRHFPSGAKFGFLLIIANIVAPNEVMLSPYLYTQESWRTYSKTGQIVTLQAANVFKKTKDIQDTIKIGKETKRDEQRGQLARSQHYSSHVGMGYTCQQQPAGRTHPYAYSNVEYMEVDDNTRSVPQQKWKRH